LFISKGIFLGFLISLEGITADPAKIAAIYNRPISTITIEVRGFINIIGYLYNLIKGYLEKIGALTNYTSSPKGQPV
jgi:hypothetical protein